MNEIRDEIEKILCSLWNTAVVEEAGKYNSDVEIRRAETAIKALIKEKADGLRLEHYGVLKNRIYRAALTALLKELEIE